MSRAEGTTTVAPKDRILDTYGLFARDYGGWIAVSGLIALMRELGLDAQSVRSAASRMKRSGLLVSERVDGKAGYALSAHGNEILEAGDQRIFAGGARLHDASWLVVLFSIPESEREKRYFIRSRLARLGFAPGPATSWIAPAALLEEARTMLERSGLAGYVTFFEGELRAEGSDSHIASSAWNLDGINKLYEEYLAVHRPIADAWGAAPDSDRDAFVHHMNNVSSWRPLPYADPGLPRSATPPGWLADEARAVFMKLNRQLRPGAHRFYLATVGAAARR
ncbi:MAG: PaaX family transcriptional regulator [Acidimicrobiaceae bacterium]|nr:PaaX family transcriptional regulator [Acidimicrobiaceae bacterium]MYE98574.1 PaaX family transcriptional regulator [Acidimicrobiaceae bacterium]MYH43490.1 PaaX family transcriptional regulator [Acidimicrobiaceae bacterium]MYI54729.1 PaaX family transcriptional regulator [Acidimicrobiaceae bacterium]MYK75025.1 PaaX family transcriptional regulator [Acidimicrobiaceae bacterium]